MSLISHLPPPNLAPPILSQPIAIASCTLFTVSYVSSLYLHPAGRITATKDDDGNVIDRDHPTVIRARIITASLATAVTIAATGLGLWFNNAVPRSGWLLETLNISRLLGLPLPTPSLLNSNSLPFNPTLSSYLVNVCKQIAAPLLLTSLLFLGPITVSFLDRQLPFQRFFSFHRDLVEKVTTLAGIRNFLVGPITEELVFRTAILTTLLFSGVSNIKLIFASPIFFGIAHAHHAYNVYLQGGRTTNAAFRGLSIATLQFAYTGVFGWYANFLFLRSGSILGSTTAHIFCNIMGLPNPIDACERHPTSKSLIWIAHAAGIVLFAKYLFPFTSASILGPSLYWPQS
ncbi:related to CAAX prenyl protease 2 [Melanopsichium pennsylvanicum]|uniref:intramembrane prenyl-peptidase Rce1 n=1 Tax=Melanopsichium pennsylvanicum TaxID=63383 RepID=A0AAJ4XTL1_9BASI|nr:related to CAAX prenyl protease 2 [Melanopsichium pennsylvanicum]